jgi:ankyrin repeat protein
MDEQQFGDLLRHSSLGNADVVLPAVDLEPGLVTRGRMDGCTLLHSACKGKIVACTDLARSLLDRKADLNQRDVISRNALSHASIAGFVPTLELLVSCGADVDSRWNLKALPALFGPLSLSLPASSSSPEGRI